MVYAGGLGSNPRLKPVNASGASLTKVEHRQTYRTVAERMMALVSKTRRSNVLGGSNPPRPAKIEWYEYDCYFGRKRILVPSLRRMDWPWWTWLWRHLWHPAARGLLFRVSGVRWKFLRRKVRIKRQGRFIFKKSLYICNMKHCWCSGQSEP